MSVPLLAVALLGGLVIRLAVLDVPGHAGDVQVMSRWAESMARYGPWSFYAHDSSIYPALLYVLWPLGAALDGPPLHVAVKGLSIPFDLGVALALWAVTKRSAGPTAGLAAAALYVLNPVPVLGGPIWGQVDAAGTLAYLGALVTVAARRHALAGGLAVLAGLIKPQFGLVALVVASVIIIRALRTGSWRPVATTMAGAAGAYAAVAIPLLLDPAAYVMRLMRTAESQPFTSLSAFNPWALLIGFREPDQQYVAIGALLLATGLAAALFPLRRRRGLATILAVGALLVLAFYFLPTRVHERYLLPAVAILAPFAATGLRFLVPYLMLSVAYAMSFAYALIKAGAWTVPTWLEEALLSSAAVWVIGVAMIASSAALVVLLVGPGARREIGPPDARASSGARA